MRFFIEMMKSMDGNSFIMESIQYLDSTNWRIREEILNLLIIRMMKEISPNLNFEHVTGVISKLVNDENAKVRFVAREALATLAKNGDQEKVMQSLGEIVVHNDFVKIVDILNNNTIVTFNEK